jgi:putative tryptophan/tyrosine transport system substrate-binding protein
MAVWGLLLAAPFAAFAQQPSKVYRIGFLNSETLSAQASRVDALRAGLREQGYVEGNNIAIEIRSADGNYDLLPELAAELVSLKVDVLVAFGQKAVSAATGVTKTIPIVGPVMGDPASLGISGSLAHPGGNVTGSVQFSPEVNAKRLEFLKEAIPRITRVAILLNPANSSSPTQLQEVRLAADALKLELQVLEVQNAKDFGETFAVMAQRHIEGVVISSDTLFGANLVALADLAAKQRIPLAGRKETAAAGGLIGYSVDATAPYRRAAYFIDRLLKGAKPADLPIERATKLDLVINLKTAKALGVTIPQSLLVRADDVIR